MAEQADKVGARRTSGQVLGMAQEPAVVRTLLASIRSLVLAHLELLRVSPQA